jgi:hypothetical protein
MPDCIGCRIGCRIELDDTILHKHNPVENRHRKVHLMSDDNHRHPFLRKLANHVEHVADKLGFSADVGSSNRIISGHAAARHVRPPSAAGGPLYPPRPPRERRGRYCAGRHDGPGANERCPVALAARPNTRRSAARERRGVLRRSLPQQSTSALARVRSFALDATDRSSTFIQRRTLTA